MSVEHEVVFVGEETLQKELTGDNLEQGKSRLHRIVKPWRKVVSVNK